jgi:hypothetical protein
MYRNHGGESLAAKLGVKRISARSNSWVVCREAGNGFYTTEGLAHLPAFSFSKEQNLSKGI